MNPTSALVRLVCLGALMLAAPRAIAQTDAGESRHPAPLAESLWGPARDDYQAALTLVASGDQAGALAKYKEAYDASHDPRLLFDMALCERDLHSYARMQGLLERYIREAGEAIEPEQRTSIDSALTAIHALVGTVKLSVNEAGADVTVDQESIGVTPLPPFALDAGTHSLRVRKAGFDTIAQVIDVRGGNETNVAITFVALTPSARLVISTDSAATILVDKTALGHGRFDERLRSGAHAIQVTETGKRPYQTEIDLADGEVRTLHLTPIDEPHSALWPWLAGGAVVVAGAIVGGYFLFRPHEEASGPMGSLGTIGVQ